MARNGNPYPLSGSPEYMRAWRAANRDKVLSHKRTYQKNHGDAINARQTARRHGLPMPPRVLPVRPLVPTHFPPHQKKKPKGVETRGILEMLRPFQNAPAWRASGLVVVRNTHTGLWGVTRPSTALPAGIWAFVSATWHAPLSRWIFYRAVTLPRVHRPVADALFTTLSGLPSA